MLFANFNVLIILNILISLIMDPAYSDELFDKKNYDEKSTIDAITIKKSNLYKIKKLIPIIRNISIEAVNKNFQNHFY